MSTEKGDDKIVHIEEIGERKKKRSNVEKKINESFEQNNPQKVLKNAISHQSLGNKTLLLLLFRHLATQHPAKTYKTKI